MAGYLAPFRMEGNKRQLLIQTLQRIECRDKNKKTEKRATQSRTVKILSGQRIEPGSIRSSSTVYIVIELGDVNLGAPNEELVPCQVITSLLHNFSTLPGGGRMEAELA